MSTAGKRAPGSSSTAEAGRQSNEQHHALLSVLQELTVAALELFDPKRSADVFLDRLAERLGCYAALLFEVHPEAGVSLQSAAGVSPPSRALPIPAETARAIAEERPEYELPYPELDRAGLLRWTFLVADPDPASPDWALVLCFKGEPSPKQLRGMVRRLSGILQTVLVHRNLFARTIESERRLAEQKTRLERAEAERERLLLTEQAARVAAEEAIHARDEFLSIASHELRTPLTTMQLLVEAALRAGRHDPAPASGLSRASLESIERQTNHLDKLIDGLLDVSLIQAGRLQLDLEATDLVAVTREVLSRFKTELQRSGFAVSLLGREPIIGAWDRARIDQIVTNLISNAIKYGRGKPIEVRIETRDAQGVLVVRDQGLGIAKEHLPQMFQRFERAVSARQYGGLGLGLYIVRQLVEMHGGSVAVESEAGVGSSFTVTLPLQASRARMASTTSSRSNSRSM